MLDKELCIAKCTGTLHNFAMLQKIQGRAEYDLEYIRRAMERTVGVSAVSGRGGMLMGGIGCLVGCLAFLEQGIQAQLAVWIAAAPLALACGTIASILKMRGTQVHWDPIRRFLLCLGPSLVVGALLTWRMWDLSSFTLIAPTWMLLYGAGVLAAGTYAVSTVSQVGIAFLILGAVALVASETWHNALLTASFGMVHLVFGWRLYRAHGG